VATYQKRGGKWQAIVRHKNIGTTSRSFHTKQAAVKWAISVEEQLEAETFGTLRPTHITLGEILERYSGEVTLAKRGGRQPRFVASRGLSETPSAALEQAILHHRPLLLSETVGSSMSSAPATMTSSSSGTASR